MTHLLIRLLEAIRGKADPLIGDLVEEVRRGRSALWLWRQTVVALAMGARSDLRRHPVDGLRAALALALLVPAGLRLFSWLPSPILWLPIGPTFPGFDWISAVMGFVASVFCGRVATVMAGAFRRAVLILLGMAGTAIIAQSGWTVAGVLSQYPWNGFLILTRCVSIYGLFVALFLVGLWLGGSNDLPRTAQAAPVEKGHA